MSVSDYDMDSQPVTISRESYRRLMDLESQLTELREAVWTLHDYVDLPPSDYGTDDLDRAWDLFLKTYRTFDRNQQKDKSK